MSIIGGGLINPSNRGSSSSSSNQLALSDGLACFTASFSGVTTTQFSHNLDTSALVVEFKDSGGNLLIPDNWSIINNNVIEAEFPSPTTGDVTIVGCIESGLAPITGGVTTIEGLSGIVDVDSPNNSILITTSGQVLQLNALFTPASGAVLEQKCRDIDTLSGLIGAGGGVQNQTSINGLSGQVQLTSPNNSILIGDNGQAIELSGLFTTASGQLLESLVSGSGVRSINDISGIVNLVSENDGLIITNDGQVIRLTSLFNSASGSIIDQHQGDIATLSGITDGLPRTQTTVEGLSGAIGLDSPNDTISIVVNGQTIELDSIFTWASGQLLESLANASGIQALNGLSGLVDIVAGNNGLLVNANNQLITLTPLFTYASGQIIDENSLHINIVSGITDSLLRSGTTVEGVSGIIDLDSPNDTISIVVNGQVIELDSIFTWTSGQLLESLANASGVDSLNGISGIVDLVANNNGITVTNDGQVIRLETLFTYTSGQIIDQNSQDIIDLSGSISRCATRTFTPISGTEFVLQHDLGTQHFVFDMWKTDEDPEAIVIPQNVYPSGVDNAVVILDSSMSGRITFIGCDGTGAGFQETELGPVDTRAVIGDIQSDTSGSFNLGAPEAPFSGLFVDDVNVSGTSTFDNSQLQFSTFTRTFVHNGGTATFTALNAGNVALQAIHNSPSTSNFALEALSINDSFATAVTRIGATRSANLAYSFLRATSDTFGGDEEDTEFDLRGDGNAFADGSFTGGGADYAEYFESVNGNRIPRGLAVQLAPGGKIRVANNADAVIGFVSATPSFAGDAAPFRWKDKYLRDEFGAYRLDPSGNRIPNSKFDPRRTYIPRGRRQEWAPIGIIGKIAVRVSENITGNWVTLGVSGMLKNWTSESTRWPVLETLREFNPSRGFGVVKILFK